MNIQSDRKMKLMRLLLLNSIMLSHTALAYTPRAIYDARDSFKWSIGDTTEYEGAVTQAKKLGCDAILLPKIILEEYVTGTDDQKNKIKNKYRTEEEAYSLDFLDNPGEKK